MGAPTPSSRRRAGEAFGRLHGEAGDFTPSIPHIAKGVKTIFPQFAAATVGDDAGAAQVVSERITGWTLALDIEGIVGESGGATRLQSSSS